MPTGLRSQGWLPLGLARRPAETLHGPRKHQRLQVGMSGSLYFLIQVRPQETQDVKQDSGHPDQLFEPEPPGPTGPPHTGRGKALCPVIPHRGLTFQATMLSASCAQATLTPGAGGQLLFSEADTKSGSVTMLPPYLIQSASPARLS